MAEKLGQIQGNRKKYQICSNAGRKTEADKKNSIHTTQYFISKQNKFTQALQ